MIKLLPYELLSRLAINSPPVGFNGDTSEGSKKIIGCLLVI
jgi:hypothetical protein